MQPKLTPIAHAVKLAIQEMRLERLRKEARDVRSQKDS